MDLLKTADFATHVQHLQEEWHVPGLAIALVQGETTISKAFGQASLVPLIKCTPDSLFDIASSSKSLTAASVAVLVDDDDKYPDIQWGAKMSSLLPEDFVMSQESYTKDITVEDILSHRTGLPSHEMSILGIKANKPDTPKSITRNLRNLEISDPIRSKFMYNNIMYTVATHLIEQTTGFSFSDFLQTTFFGPLDMSSTHLQPAAARAVGLGDKMVTSYVWDESSDGYSPLSDQECPEAQGAGSITTSVNDYIKYVKAIMNQEAPFTEDIYKGLIKPRIFEDPESDDLDPFTSPPAYAAGWMPRFYRGHLLVQHEGAITGFGSIHFFVPSLKFGGVVLGNSAGAIELTPLIAYELIDEALGVPEAERPDWNARFAHKMELEDATDDAEELMKELCPDCDDLPRPQERDLSEYTGKYWNDGYRSLEVVVEDGKLFVDATDRSFPFTLVFEHVCDQTKYIANVEEEGEAGDDPMVAEFEIEDDKVVKLGLDFEPDLGELIWFSRL